MKTLGADGHRARIVFTADNHLGRKSGSGSDTDSTNASLIDRDAFRKVAQYCSKESAHALLIVGDLFDSPAPNPDDLAFTAGILRDLRQAEVFVGAICGDADLPPTGAASAIELLAQLGLLVNLDRAAASAPFPLQLGQRDIAISSLPRHPESAHDHGSLGLLDRRCDADFHILLAHVAVEGMNGARTPEPAINADAVRALVGVDVLVSGHAHVAEHRVFGDTTVIVPGSPVGDPSECGFVRLDISARGIEDVVVIDGIQRPITEMRIAASRLAGDGAMAALMQEIEPNLLPGSAVRVSIVGRLDADSFRRAGLAELSQWASRRCADFVIDVSGLRVEREHNGTHARASASPYDEVRRTVDALKTTNGSHSGTVDAAADLLLRCLRAEFGS